jgi:hypothetical protein
MAIDIGDAVLTFLGDTTQLDSAYQRVGVEAPAKMAPATAAVTETSTAVEGMTQRMAVGAQGAVELGEVTTLAGEKAQFSMYEARGEAGLLGEAFGIHLPRHVRSFIAELPGVGTALSAAFSATAVLFLLDALLKGIEKISEWAEHGEKVAAAWEKYDQTIFESSTHMQKEIDKQEQKLVEMTQGPVAGLDFALKHLQTTAFDTFSLITKDVDAAVKAMNEASSSLMGIQFNVFKDAGKDLDKFKDELQKAMRLADESHPGDPFAAYNAGISAVQQKERELTKLIHDRTAASGRDASAAVDGLHAERQAVNEMLPVLEQGIRLQKDKNDVLKQSRDSAALQESEKLLKAQTAAEQREADAQLKLWMDNRAQAIANLEASEKEKIDATRAGSQARLAAIEAALKEEESKGLQDTGFYRSLQEQKVKFFEAALAESQKAANQAAADALKKSESDAKLETALVTEQYSQQEKAVSLLATFKLASATQTSQRLELLYTQESQKLLKILDDQLKKEEEAVKAAQAKLTAAQNNPFISPQQVEDLKRLLLAAEQAEAATRVRISNTTKEFQDKQLALDKGHYGQSLALATAFGNSILAEKLKENHAALLVAQAQLAEAKARGVNTDAIDKQVKALQHVENELNKEARGLKTTSAAVDKFKQDLKAAAEQEVAAFSSATEAMITGQESFGRAMEASTLKIIGTLANKWGEYYAALAIADLLTPGAQAKGAAELAASIALFALGGALSGISSNLSNGGRSGAVSGSSNTGITQNASTQAGGPTTSTVNIPKLGGGGLITQQTLAIVGDAPGGGSRREAVIPLDDAEATRQIVQAFGGSSRGGGGDTYHIYLPKGFAIGTVQQLGRTITRASSTGRANISVRNAFRNTPRS